MDIKKGKEEKKREKRGKKSSRLFTSRYSPKINARLEIISTFERFRQHALFKITIKSNDLKQWVKFSTDAFTVFRAIYFFKNKIKPPSLKQSSYSSISTIISLQRSAIRSPLIIAKPSSTPKLLVKKERKKEKKFVSISTPRWPRYPLNVN